MSNITPMVVLLGQLAQNPTPPHTILDFEELFRALFHNPQDRAGELPAYRLAYDELWQHRASSTLQQEKVRGQFGLALLSAELVLAKQERMSPSDYLEDAAVRNAIHDIYHDATLGREIDVDTLRFHQAGTTSFILRCSSPDAGRDVFALKCLHGTFQDNLNITQATERYLKDVGEPTLPVSGVPKVYGSTRRAILMEFIEGIRLSTWISGLQNVLGKAAADRGLASILNTRRDRTDTVEIRLRIREATRIVSEVVDLLESLSQLDRPLSHLDISTDNIILDFGSSDISLSLVDFGRNYLLTERIPGFAGKGATERSRSAPELSEEAIATGTGLAYSSQHAKIDIYALGYVLLDVLVPPTTAGGDGNRIDTLYKVLPLLAQFLDDLIAPPPHLRLIALGTPNGVDFSHLSNELRAITDTLLSEDFPASTVPTKSKSPVSWVLARNLSQVWYLGKSAKEFRARSDGVLSRDLTRSFRWASLPIVLMFILVSAALVNFLAKFGVDWQVAGSTRIFSLSAQMRVPDLDWFTIAPGLIVGVTFAIVAARYYVNIFSNITFRGSKVLRNKLAELSMRLNSFVFSLTCGTLIFYEPRWWGYAAFVGTSVVAINNHAVYYASWSILHRQVISVEGIEHSADWALGSGTVSALRNFVTPNDFRLWAMNMYLYSIVILVVGILLAIGAARDAFIYATIVGTLNLLKLYVSNCERLAPRLRGSITRLAWLQRRLEWWSESDPQVHVFTGAIGDH